MLLLVLRAYDRDGEALRQEIALPELQPERVRDLFGRPPSEPVEGCYPVNENLMPRLAEVFNVEIDHDFKKYEYFLELANPVSGGSTSS